jgi:hypothetical protein
LLDAAQNPSRILILLDIVVAAFSFYIGLSLWRVGRHALGILRFAFIVMLFVGLLLILSSIAQNWMAARPRSDPQFWETLAVATQPVSSVIIWWSYFKKSRRVRYTFGRNI